MTASSSDDRPQIEVSSDEDWKARVKADDAKLDAEASAKVSVTDDSDDDSEGAPSMENLPEASMFTLFQLLSTQAIVAMGLIPGPNGKSTVQLPVAKHFIDVLSLLQSKTKGNLTGDEDRFLDATLHELRMAFVASSKKGSAS